METKDKSHKVAEAMIRSFAGELGSVLVRNNRERSRKRLLRVLDEITNGGANERDKDRGYYIASILGSNLS